VTHSAWPFVTVGVSVVAIATARLLRPPLQRAVLPLSACAIFIALWQLGCELKRYELRRPDGSVRLIEIFPTPAQTLVALGSMSTDGTLLRYTVASLYRVGVGFGLAVLVGVPLGLLTGWSTRTFWAVNPMVQILRPISPLAWIPVAILWFGVEDAAAIFLIFLCSIFPIVTGAIAAVHSIPTVFVRTARNFRLKRSELFRYIVFPACLPQIVTSLRMALGVAWLVIVAAEMIAVQSGLGYVITDARNGNNYPRVLAAMVCIGLIGLGLDTGIRQLQRLDEVRWGFSKV
jgi:NitT/TauT family transport system permease protein